MNCNRSSDPPFSYRAVLFSRLNIDRSVTFLQLGFHPSIRSPLALTIPLGKPIITFRFSRRPTRETTLPPPCTTRRPRVSFTASSCGLRGRISGGRIAVSFDSNANQTAIVLRAE